MSEPEKQAEIEAHPLYPLYKLASNEAKTVFARLQTQNFSNQEENAYQAFLQEEVKGKVALEIGHDLSLVEKNLGFQEAEYLIKNLEKRKSYEQKWKAFLEKVRSEKPDDFTMLAEIKKLFDTWNKEEKITVIPNASLN